MLKAATDYTAEEWRKIIDVNLTGTFLVAQAFGKEWLAANPDVGGEAGGGGKGASVVMTGSMSGHVANFGLECAAYNASKAGVGVVLCSDTGLEQ